MFKRNIGSRIMWGVSSLFTIVVAYLFSTIDPTLTDTISVLARSLYPVGYAAGAIGLIFLSILDYDIDDKKGGDN